MSESENEKDPNENIVEQDGPFHDDAKGKRVNKKKESQPMETIDTNGTQQQY